MLPSFDDVSMSMRGSADEAFMRAALLEAAKGVGQTSPNPAVGAVLVIGNRIVAKGHHRRAGQPHAEIECLRSYNRPLRKGATLYVTLEPCSTAGRTPPCTQVLIDAGLEKVVIGAVDVNPIHQGRGLALLRAAGVTVRAGVLAAECTALNEAFNKWTRTKRPLVIAKCGMTLDGRLTRPHSEERWITSAPARKHANRFRAQVDAIMIGAETLRTDNPRLTARGVRGARQPWRVVLSRSGKVPRDAHLFTDRWADRTIVFRNQSLEAVLQLLGKREITSVLLEGGGDMLGQALDAHLIDKVHIYLGPLFSGGPVIAFPGLGAASTHKAARLYNVRYEKIGSDLFFTAQTTDQATSSE